MTRTADSRTAKRLFFSRSLRQRIESEGLQRRTLAISNSVTEFAPDETIRWSELDSLPSVVQFELVVVVPAESTLEEQRRLLEILKGDLSIQSGAATKIVWIINRYCLPDIGLLVSDHPLVALRSISGGRIVSYLPGARISVEDVAFAFSDPSKSAGVTARWIDDGRVSAPIGVITTDDQWLLTPPVSGLDIRAVDFSAFRNLQLLVWTLLVFAFLVATLAGLRIATVSKTNYIRGASWVAVQDPIKSNFIPAWHRAATSTWRGADARMADRLIYDEYRALQYLSPDLEITKRPYEIWNTRVNGDKDEDAIAFYHLALLSGDTESAFQIAMSASQDYSYASGWIRALSVTFWQASVESLHELNIGRAKYYDDVFLSASRRPMEEIDRRDWSAVQRNRTLAWILSRELGQRRILSVCSKPGVAGSFGRLIEPPIPAELPGLEQRRSFFAQTACSASAKMMPKTDYNKLASLEELVELESGQPMTPSMQDICLVAPLECDYIRLRKRLRLTFASDQGVIDAALSFSTTCTYLSDDMVFDILREAKAAGETGAPIVATIDLELVRDALHCAREFGLDSRSDYEDYAADLDCSWFSNLASVSSADLGAFAEILERCGRE